MIYPGEVETPILDARPVPVGAERAVFSNPKTSRPLYASWSSCIRGHTCRSWSSHRQSMISAEGTEEIAQRLARRLDLVQEACLDLAAGELVKLGVYEVAKHLAVGLKLFGRAHVFDTAIVQHDHVVARLHGREPVRNDDERAADREPRQGVVDEVPRVFIEHRLGLFDDQDRGIVEVGRASATRNCSSGFK